MVKYLLNMMLITFLASSLCWAKDNSLDLQKDYGSQLKGAPFALKNKFYKEYNKDWNVSSYAEREEFLTWWEEGAAKDRADAQAKAKVQAQEDKERLAQKKESERQDRAKLRQEKSEAQAEQRAQDERDRAFRKKLQDEKRALDLMRRQQKQREQRSP